MMMMMDDDDDDDDDEPKSADCPYKKSGTSIINNFGIRKLFLSLYLEECAEIVVFIDNGQINVSRNKTEDRVQ